jgi:dTDP-4-amino-4,6-dideoxygalactose transaminase
MTPDRLDRLRRMRDGLMGRLAKDGIATRQGTHAVHALRFYREKYGLDPWDIPGAWVADNLSIALPLYPQMTSEEQEYVVAAVERHAPPG